MASVSAFRDHLLASLSTLPGTRRFHIHVLASTPRKPSKPLYLHATRPPKCVQQDIFILLSEEQQQQQRAFVTAIEASVFAFPATQSAILYVSKVDGTGQGIYPSPTSTLVKSFLAFYAGGVHHHLWIHVFARAQRQYLFPNSADHPSKKPLGDIALCKWWKKTLTEVPGRLYFILPGQSEQEAACLLDDGPGPWIYSHPYTQQDMPCGSTTEHIGSLIPHFEDDPKSRFLDELAATSEEHTVAVPVPTPKRKRQKLDRDQASETTLAAAVMIPASSEGPNAARYPKESAARLPELAVISQEAPPSCPSTPVPAARLPELAVIPASSPPSMEAPPSPPSTPCIPPALLSPRTPEPNLGCISPRTPPALLSPEPNVGCIPPRTPRRKSEVDTVSVDEFWERMSYRQECAQGAVTGFFVAIVSCEGDWQEPVLSKGTVPHTVIGRVRSCLLTGVEFSTTERTWKSTQVIESAIEGLCDGLDTYASDVYGSVAVTRAALTRTEMVASSFVNILAVKRKRK